MVEKIYEMKNQLLAKLEHEMQGDRLDMADAGMLTDMVKDLAEAEERCWEAEYYRAVTEAMEKGYQPPRMIRRGYDMERRMVQP